MKLLDIFKKLILTVTILLIVFSLFGCDETNSTLTSTTTCTKPAEVVAINPDPAFLNQAVTIHVPGSSVADLFQEVTITDTSGSIMRHYEYPMGELPKGVIPSSTDGWKWNETFTSGMPGRWKITGEYKATLKGGTVTIDGSFCMNKDTAPGEKITGDVVRQNSGKIAFMSDRDGNVEIYVMNADGSGQKNLTNNPAIDKNPAWSPDGKKIAFDSYRDGNQDIYVMNADGSGQKNLTNDLINGGYPAWSPDGKKIAFDSYRDGNWEIYVMNADGSGQKRLTNNPADDNFPSWSPDGKKIAFMSDRDGNLEIIVMNADGSGLENLTNNPADDGYPSWSPFLSK